MENPHKIKLEKIADKGLKYSDTIFDLCDSLIAISEEIQKVADAFPKTYAQYPYSDAELNGDWNCYLSNRTKEISITAKAISDVAMLNRDIILEASNNAELFLAFEEKQIDVK